MFIQLVVNFSFCLGEGKDDRQVVKAGYVTDACQGIA